jgi:nucleotide-binding universal stress UspA family protein
MAHFSPTRILCPTDMSDVSRLALRVGLTWAKKFGAKLFVLSARELTFPPRYFTPDQIEALTRQTEAAEDQVRADLELWVGEMNEGGVPVEVVVGPGPADRAILRGIEVIRPDLVVMGTHGRSGYNRFLMGSTTEKVVREIPVPLLTVRENAPRWMASPTSRADSGVRRILCAADLPKQTGDSLAIVAELTRAMGGELTVLHSLELPPWMPSAPSAVREDAERHLKELIAVHASDLKTKVVITDGPAYQRILEEANRERVDLIAVGGRQAGGPVPVFGSTAIRTMRHASCPVLALPMPADRNP